ncbi:MAG TPA: SDR family NAD(P)-dependent oxidoreductase [Candidatus Saccharimonadales bacterium]|jgi:short-subunit dehydrogenase|nr:SDR family NAD(P)-dependent oxidoreductase [Candidatus Saccharimonadales bacterium]
MKNLSGAVAVITGAGSGIGRALALELAGHGAQLALADKNQAGVEETRALVVKSNSQTTVKTYLLDVGDAAAVEGFAGSVQKDFGRASLLINNAGVALFGTFAEVSLADMEWLMRINFWGVIYGSKLFMPMLEREPEAHIVNISSAFGLIAPAGQTAYGSSKFAVRGFSQALRLELKAAGSRVQVTCVHPGGIKTNVAASARDGAGTNPAANAAAKALFSQIAATSPEQAAKVIVKGVLADKGRVLIGADAYQMDMLQRLFPYRCGDMIAKTFESRFAQAGIASQKNKT